MALSTGLQALLWGLGGVPEEHRTDSLSAAFNNIPEEQELTRRYANMCSRCGMRASRCNPGQSHENGAIESRRDALKTVLDQALRHRADSCLSPDMRLSSFDFAAVPSVSRAQVMALAEGCEWLVRGANVLVFGPPGVSKSHFVCALVHALVDAGKRMLFARCNAIVQGLQAARQELRLPQGLAKLDRFDLLILDDLSCVRRHQTETSVLFELIAERYEHRSPAVTANTPFSQLGEVFAEPGMTPAAVDRLVHYVTFLEMKRRATGVARRKAVRQRGERSPQALTTA